jgi:hypothetical protein
VALDAASFKARWPEFSTTEDSQVTAVLAESAAETDERVFGGTYDTALGLLAAHKLAAGPWGQQARMESKDGTTTYLTQRQSLARAKAGGGWLVGQTP